MTNDHDTGAVKNYTYMVKAKDVAAFHAETVHEVCSTFTLTREAEWSGRLFVLDMIDEDEEGIGTFVKIEHVHPAFVGEEIQFTTTLESIRGNEITCSFEAKVGTRTVVRGETGQKVMKKDRIKKYFETIASK